MFSDQLDNLLQTTMDRKEFLAYLGAALLAVIGVSGLLKTLTQPATNHPTSRSRPGAYGSDVYGGHR